MEIRFSTANIRPWLSGELLYRISEHSFDYAPNDYAGLEEIAGIKGRTSILIGTLQLEVGVETKAVLYAWGYAPRVSWLRANVHAPPAIKSGLKIALDSDLRAGISIRLAVVGEWRTEHNSETGWIVVSSVPDPTAGESIEFADNTIATLRSGRLVAVWLHPKLV